MARTLELDTIQTPSANNPNIQLGSDTVTFSSDIAVDINNATIDGATVNTSDITVGPGKTLDVQNGTLTTSATQKKAIIEGAGADVNLGAHEVQAKTFKSTETNSAPFTVASTHKVANLNASTLDGATKANLFNLDHADVTGVLDVNHGGTNVSTVAGQTQGTSPQTYRRKFFRGSNTGTAAAPAFGQIDSADLPVYVGATESAIGVPGAVPSAATDKRNQFLKGDGTYATPTDTNTVTSVGTTASNRTSGNITITGGTNVTTSKSSGTITIASTDTDTITSVGTSDTNKASGALVRIAGSGSVSASFAEATTDPVAPATVTLTGTDTITTVGTSDTDQTSGEFIKIVGSGSVSATYTAATTNPVAPATITISGTDNNTWRPISSTPTENATTTSISSDWAFDNVKTAVPANAVFTDNNTVTKLGTESGNVTSGDILLSGSGSVSVSKSGSTFTIAGTTPGNADASNAGLMSSADFTKLSNVHVGTTFPAHNTNRVRYNAIGSSSSANAKSYQFVFEFDDAYKQFTGPIDVDYASTYGMVKVIVEYIISAGSSSTYWGHGTTYYLFRKFDPSWSDASWHDTQSTITEKTYSYENTNSSGTRYPLIQYANSDTTTSSDYGLEIKGQNSGEEGAAFITIFACNYSQEILIYPRG